VRSQRQRALLAPSTTSAFAFKHADGFASERVKYATDEIGLCVAHLAPTILPGLFACEFFAAEEVHFPPLHERDNKCQTAQMFRERDPDIRFAMERFYDANVTPQLLQRNNLLAF